MDVRPLLPAAIFAVAAAAACGGGGDAAPEGAGPTPGVVEPAGPGPGPARPGTDGGADADAGDKPVCTRAAQAKTAPVALWDTFVKDVAALSGAARVARVDELLADVAREGGTPLEDPSGDRVVFLARGASPSGTWKVAGGFVDWDKAKALVMQGLPDTDLFSVEAKIPRGASHEYKLLASDDDGGFVPDPLAKNVAWDGIDRGFGVAGQFNAVVHPQSIAKERGRLVALGKTHAQKLGNDRDVWLYFPARYDDDTCAKLPSIVFHDGLESLTRGGFARVADTLYAQRPELSAVIAFVGLPNQEVRMQEYSFGMGDSKGLEYVDFVTEELWPRLAKESRLCGKAGARGISGASLGGLISTFAAFEKPSAWGWVGAQSPSYFWNGDAMLTRAEQTAKIPVRFYLDSGCPGDNCAETDEMDAIMTQKGYDHVRIKQNGAEHDWPFWRDRLPGLLTHFREGQTVCD